MTTLLDLTNVKSELSIKTNISDVSVQNAITSATQTIESQSLCGPFDSQDYTEVVQGCQRLILTRGPVIDLVSVAGEWVGPIDVSLLAVNPEGVIHAKRLALILFDDFYTVEYHYGRGLADADIPQAVKDAALVIVKSLLQVQKGSGAQRPGTGGTQTANVPGVPYPIPVLALQLLDPYLRGPSVG